MHACDGHHNKCIEVPNGQNRCAQNAAKFAQIRHLTKTTAGDYLVCVVGARSRSNLRPQGGWFMATSRRDFIKISTLGGAAAAVLGFDLAPAYAQLRALKIARASETRSLCPYCAVGCGVIIYSLGDRAKT